MRARAKLSVALLLLVGFMASDAAAQGRDDSATSLASRIAKLGDGDAIFTFAPRPNVCGYGDSGMNIGSSRRSIRMNDRGETCQHGPVVVRITTVSGRVDRVQSWIGGSHEGRMLGNVSTREAARYLLDVAAHGPGAPSSRAIQAAVLADSVTVWPALLSIARDSATRSRGTRAEARMWLSQFAAATLSGRPGELGVDEEDDDGARDSTSSLKRQAVFVLAQLPRHEGVPELLEVARTNRDMRTRAQALFWLGQSDDPRALDLFESILRR